MNFNKLMAVALALVGALQLNAADYPVNEQFIPGVPTPPEYQQNYVGLGRSVRAVHQPSLLENLKNDLNNAPTTQAKIDAITNAMQYATDYVKPYLQDAKNYLDRANEYIDNAISQFKSYGN